ncbi:hypothetical protein CEXT_205881 [Caerostris extrusa]|uniref:Uncharacterized protein n=1 Tax=Caerostris extrusa TaxID=172846 RepID=A0AAV4TRY7_CAEEX|nr:hypothetical protein CEXT_205881 [Caerostris extrusa]
MKKNAPCERTRMPTKDIKRRKSAMLRMRRGEGEGEKSHCSNDIIQFVFSKSRFQMKWLLQNQIFSSFLNSKKELDSEKPLLTFQGFFESHPCEKKQNWIFPPFHSKNPPFFSGWGNSFHTSDTDFHFRRKTMFATKE